MDFKASENKIRIASMIWFLRRFLQHILPAGFMRIRHYGWLTNACRKTRLPQVRETIARYALTLPMVADKPPEAIVRFDGIPCPCCKTGIMQVRYPLPPQRLEYG